MEYDLDLRLLSLEGDRLLLYILSRLSDRDSLSRLECRFLSYDLDLFPVSYDFDPLSLLVDLDLRFLPGDRSRWLYLSEEWLRLCDFKRCLCLFLDLLCFEERTCEYRLLLLLLDLDLVLERLFFFFLDFLRLDSFSLSVCLPIPCLQ